MGPLDIALLVWVLATIYLGAGFGYVVGRYGSADAFRSFGEYLSAVVWWLPDVIRQCGHEDRQAA